MAILVIPAWLEAGLWGLLSGSALLIGAAIGFLANKTSFVEYGNKT